MSLNPKSNPGPDGRPTPGGRPTSGHNLYGNLDLLVLRMLDVEGPMHGLGVMDAIDRHSGGSILVEDGALYRSMHRLEARGLLSSRWRTSDKNRKAKFYALTRAGRRELSESRKEWEEHARAVGRVLGLDWGRTP